MGIAGIFKNNLTEKSSTAINEILLFIISFVVLFFCSKCSPLYFFNEWPDVNIYFTMGKGLFSGHVLYRDLFDHKGPLIFLFYGLGSLISHTYFGIYILECLTMFAGLLFAYKIGKLFLDKNQSFLVSLLYLFFLLYRTKQGASADEFIAPCLMISTYYTLYYCLNKVEDIRLLNKIFTIQGLMFGIVFFVKLSISVFIFPLLFIPFCELVMQKRYKDIISVIIRFSLGFTLVAAPVLLYFIANSALPDFWFAYIQFNSLYASSSMGLTFNAFANIAARFASRLTAFDLYVYMLVFSIISLFFSKKYIRSIFHKICIFLSFGFLYIMVTSGPHDMDYYYITLSVFSIFGFIFLVDILTQMGEKNRYIIKMVSIPAILIFCALNKDFCTERLFSNKEESCWQQEFATIVNSHKQPTLLELGHCTGVSNLADIIPPYKYFFHPNINDAIFPDIRIAHEELIKNKEPLFIITQNLDFTHLKENYEIISQHEKKGNTTYLLERKE